MIAILVMALYGVAAAASNLKFEKKQSHHEKVWADHIQARER